MKYIAYTTKGLEQITQFEIEQKLSDVVIEEVSDKRIIFSTKQSIEKVLSFKTVDDVGVLIGQLDNLEKIKQINDLLDKDLLSDIRDFISTFRTIDYSLFSLTISSAKSDISSDELKESLVTHLTLQGLKYIEKDHANFDIRIFIDGTNACVSVRLTSESLYNRKYKTISKSGSLRPTIAASLVLLATEFKKDLKIVDTFCGSGTILCEARESGYEVFGSDSDKESVEITKNNLNNIKFSGEENIRKYDSRATGWKDNFFDCAISNLPWDKQIAVKNIFELYRDSVKEYFRILKRNGVLCVLVTKPDLFINCVQQFRPNAKVVELKIGMLGQTPTILLIH